MIATNNNLTYEIHAKREDVTRLSTQIAADSIDTAISLFREAFPGFIIMGITIGYDDIPF